MKTLLSETLIDFGDLEITSPSGSVEKTAFVFILAAGCSADCQHCRVKIFASNVFNRSEQFALSRVQALSQFLQGKPELQTVKLFFSGNCFWPEELNQIFWDKLPLHLPKHITAVEAEVRPDDLVANKEKFESVRARIQQLSQNLLAKGIKFRAILGVEYMDIEITKAITKFPGWYLQDIQGSLEKAFEFLRNNRIEILCYSMFGGLMANRPLSAVEAVTATLDTIHFLSQQRIREVIVNPQYASGELVPLVYVPKEEDAVQLLSQAKTIITHETRVRITLETEQNAEAFLQLDENMNSLIEQFNKTSDQRAFLEQNF